MSTTKNASPVDPAEMTVSPTSSVTWGSRPSRTLDEGEAEAESIDRQRDELDLGRPLEHQEPDQQDERRMERRRGEHGAHPREEPGVVGLVARLARDPGRQPQGEQGANRSQLPIARRNAPAIWPSPDRPVETTSSAAGSTGLSPVRSGRQVHADASRRTISVSRSGEVAMFSRMCPGRPGWNS